jgi:hypothetical protein
VVVLEQLRQLVIPWAVELTEQLARLIWHWRLTLAEALHVAFCLHLLEQLLRGDGQAKEVEHFEESVPGPCEREEGG